MAKYLRCGLTSATDYVNRKCSGQEMTLAENSVCIIYCGLSNQ